jgi:hypothetical protein
MTHLHELSKKIQYINVDSEFVNGTNNVFAVEFGLKSNVFIQEMRDVISVKIVDFYITQIGGDDAGTGNTAKYVDIVCPDIPMAAQILDERKGQILARIPLERNVSSASYVEHDKQWKHFNRHSNYFNPITIKKLSFEMYELQGNGNYVTLQPDASFFFTLEIVTIDHLAPKPDTNLRVIEAIDKLGRKIDKFNSHIKKVPVQLLQEPEPKKKIPMWYIGATIAAIGAGYYYYRTRSPSLAVHPSVR